MQLNKIILENYCLYAGKNEFDLAPREKYGKDRTIILFGGNNGAGKTTLLDAIRLVFYGKSILGNKVSQKDYEKFLRGQIHRSKKAILSPTYAKVGIEFEISPMGETEKYYVERAWSLRNHSGAKEFLKIFHNDEQIEAVDEEYWRGFIEEIIPERLSQLFFFDGEKIKRIAKDETSNHALAESIKTLLGLDLVERLKADLTIYASREAKRVSSKEDKVQLDALEKKIEELEGSIQHDNDELTSLASSLTGLESEIAKNEKKLSEQGYGFATKREKLVKEEALLSAQIEELEQQVRGICETTLPFALCPSINKSLLEQIQLEKDARRQNVIHEELSKLKTEISNVIPKVIPAREQIIKLIDMAFSKRLSKKSTHTEKQEIHGISSFEEQQIIVWLNDAEENATPQIKILGNKINIKNERLRKVTQNILRSPDEVLLQPIFDIIKSLNIDIGMIQQKQNQLHKTISSNSNDKAQLERDKKRIEEKQKLHGKAQARLELSQKAHDALNLYHIKLTEAKVEQLRKAVTESFNTLSRKGAVLSDIEIDSTTFAVTLFDHEGNDLPKEKLSAGEKQIFAISLLWGLAKTAGRSLPVIIDTPLGRLDSEHRNILIKQYFPTASSQVIMLSTDTEVDNNLYKNLSKHISHCYHLDYDREQKITIPKEGYFWRNQANA